MNKENQNKDSHNKYSSPKQSKSKRLIRIGAPFLALAALFIFAFQNCNKDSSDLQRSASAPGPISPAPPSGDKTFFEVSSEYGEEKTISNILWEVKDKPCHGASKVIATGTNSSIEVNWNSNVSVEAFIQFEGQECISYRQRDWHLENFMCTTEYSFEDFKRDYNPWKILTALSSDQNVKKNYFPVNSSVDLEFIEENENQSLENESNLLLDSLEFTSFQWSIKKAGNETELADQTNKTAQLSHTFAELGVYDVTVKANLATDHNEETTYESSDHHFQALYEEIKANGGISKSQRLIIGKCEGEDGVDMEVILSGKGIGSNPFWNYIRPADTDTNSLPSAVILETDDYRYDKKIYKYKRGSESKFIDIDIHNADECFLDPDPIANEVCDKSDPSQCDIIGYTMREDLSALASCSGKALDMAEFDTDTTECTDNIFIAAASQITNDDELDNKEVQPFYKHCPADSEYCYFGHATDRPYDHRCPDEDAE